MKASAHVMIALAGMLASLLLAVALHALIGGWGRDLRPAGTFMAFLLAATAFYLAHWQHYRVRELVAALLLAELVFVAATGWFGYGGLPRWDRFFRSWIGAGNLFIAAPWLIGMGAAGWLARRASVAHDRKAER